MLELLNPTLPGAARAMADMARFRALYACTPASRASQLLAKRFMSPVQQKGPVTTERLLSDLKRFGGDWYGRLGTTTELAARVDKVLADRRLSTLVDKGEKIVLHQWQPSKRARRGAPRCALLSHGWESYGLSYALVIERLRSLGYAVNVIDHAAHGESEGEYSGLPRFAEVLVRVSHHLQECGSRVDLGVGHSLGGGAWLMAATKLGLTPGRLLLLAPFIDTPELLGKWLRLHGVPVSARAGMQEAMLALHGPTPMAFDDMNLEMIAARLKVPTTIVQDREDFIAPARHALHLARLNPLVRNLPADGAGHVGVLFHPDALACLG
jgi:pimeloyl-ACP methyl ester carboxylesterase